MIAKIIKEEAMVTRCLTLMALITALAILSGCGGHLLSLSGKEQTMLEENWGRSFETAKYSQILNPEAGKNSEPVTGLDGPAAKENMEKYRQAFKEKPPTSINVFQLGTLEGAGSTKGSR